MFAPEGQAACIFKLTVSWVATTAFFFAGSHPAKNPPATTVATAALAKNFLLEGGLLTLRDFLSLIIISPLLVFVN